MAVDIARLLQASPPFFRVYIYPLITTKKGNVGGKLDLSSFSIWLTFILFIIDHGQKVASFPGNFVFIKNLPQIF